MQEPHRCLGLEPVQEEWSSQGPQVPEAGGERGEDRVKGLGQRDMLGGCDPGAGEDQQSGRGSGESLTLPSSPLRAPHLRKV